jgi:hypothetical protein
VKPDNFECRAPAVNKECDISEFCDGYTNTCPANGYQGENFECRPAKPTGCDVAEYCIGTSPDCPADDSAPDTTVCIEYDYNCTSNQCGGDVERRERERYCNGSNTRCNGTLITDWTDWEIVVDCLVDEKCHSGYDSEVGIEYGVCGYCY